MAWLIAVVIVGAGALALVLYRRGAAHERARHEAREVNEYVEARRRMDAVNHGRDPDDLRDWLRERARQSGRDL